MILRILLFAALAAGLYLLWLRLARRPERMSASEARALLGVDSSASAEDIRQAHRRLIAKVHPDAGGSDALANRVNEARDVLLAGRPEGLK
jgi:preprotein translocase subunit Sec63